MAKKKEVDKSKDSSMDDFFAKIDKQMGGGVIKSGDDDCFEIKRISSGIPELDLALGGGYPVSKHVQIKGKEHVGKSWMCFKAIAQLHKDDPKAYAVYINVENLVDRNWAKKIGVDLKRMKIVEGELTAEEFWDIVSKLLSNPNIKIIVLDSLALMAPRKEITEKNGSMNAFTTQSVATQAQTNTQAMRAINYKMKNNSAVIIYINQIRYKVGQLYGNPETSPGGQAIKHQLAVDISVRKGKYYPDEKNGENATGHYINLKVTKNKTYKEQQTASFIMMRDGSLNEVAGVLAMAKELDYLEECGIKSGNTYTVNGEKVAKNIREFEEYLKKDKKTLNKIREGVNSILLNEGNEYELSLEANDDDFTEEELN